MRTRQVVPWGPILAIMAAGLLLQVVMYVTMRDQARLVTRLVDHLADVAGI